MATSTRITQLSVGTFHLYTDPEHITSTDSAFIKNEDSQQSGCHGTQWNAGSEIASICWPSKIASIQKIDTNRDGRKKRLGGVGGKYH